MTCAGPLKKKREPCITYPNPNACCSLSLCGAQDGKSEALRQPLSTGKYQEVHTTIVRGVVDRAYFGLKPSQTVPASVMLTELAAGLAFSSLALHAWVGDSSDGLGVYKIFSRCKGSVISCARSPWVWEHASRGLVGEGRKKWPDLGGT